MRIAVVVSTFPPYKGGMGNVAAAHVDALRRAGHEVKVFSPGSGIRPLFRWGNAAWVPQLLWKLCRFDAVELHYPFFGGAEAVWLWKKLFGRRKRFVVVYHMDTVGSGWLAAVFRGYRRIFLHRILASADRILVTSRDYFASSQAKAFASEPRVRETPLSVDGRRFSPGPAHGRARALFVGGLDRAHYFKGVDLLLEAFASLRDLQTAELAIVGDGDLRHAYEDKAQRLGIADRIRFLGAISDRELPDAYRAASFLVLPSIDRSEAFGLVTLEAAASGLPAIVSDLPGVRTSIEPGVTGLLVRPGDKEALASAMRRFLAEPALTERMGRAARQRVLERYASETVDRLIVDAVAG